MRRTALLLAVLGLLLVGFAGIASSASATFHLMKLREVSPGTNGLDNSYIEVQMYAPFQNFLSNGAKLAVCNADCSIIPATFTGFTDVANGNNQDTLVFGDSGVAAAGKDFGVNLNLDTVEAGGAACYVSEPGFSDCVSWGNFHNNTSLTTNFDNSANPGSPAPALTSGMALRRSIAANCPTALDAADDTNNSANDFGVTTPNPRPNSVPPTEVTCSTSGPIAYPTQPNAPSTAKRRKCKKRKRPSGSGSTSGGAGSAPAYAAKKKCKKKRK